MSAFNITLTDQVSRWLEDQVAVGGFPDASAYVEELIRQDRERDLTFGQLQAMITEGLESGTSDLTVDDIWGGVKARATNG